MFVVSYCQEFDDIAMYFLKSHTYKVPPPLKTVKTWSYVAYLLLAVSKKDSP